MNCTRLLNCRVHSWLIEHYLNCYEWMMGPNMYSINLIQRWRPLCHQALELWLQGRPQRGDFKKERWCET